MINLPPPTLEQHKACGAALEKALNLLRNTKPEDRSGLARRYAVTITDLEKVIGYFETWVIRETEPE